MNHTTMQRLDTNFLIVSAPLKTNAPFLFSNAEAGFLLFKEPGPKNIGDCVGIRAGSNDTSVDPPLLWLQPN